MTDFTGYVTLRVAAQKIGRSVARTRQYVKDGSLSFKRDEMGHLMVSSESLDQFKAPERGAARAAGVNPGTLLRHARVTKKIVESMVSDGPTKTTTIAVLNAVIQKLAEKAAAAEAAKGEAETVNAEAEAIEDAVDAETEIVDDGLDSSDMDVMLKAL